MAPSPPIDIGALLRRCRESAGLTQVELADRSGTSSTTLSHYENGNKEPRITTLARLVESAGFDFSVAVRTRSATTRPPTREERRSLELHRRIAKRLLTDPDSVMTRARANHRRLWSLHDDGSADRWLQQWGEILDGPPGDVALRMTDPSQQGRDLRQNTPFAGVLEPTERWAVYREFAA